MKASRKIYLKNYDIEDFVSISIFSLYKAIKCFSLTDENHFFPYAIMSIKNNLNMEIRKASKNWRESSFEVYAEKGEMTVSVDNETLIEDIFVNKEGALYFTKELNLEEKSIIISIYYDNLSMADYARINRIDYKKCKNLKIRAIRKMRKLIKK